MIKDILIKFIIVYIIGMVMSGCLPNKRGIPCGGLPYRDPGTMIQGEIMHVPTGFNVSKDQFFDMISLNRILYVGEHHDNIYDHQMELEIIKNLYLRFPGKIAVGMEMLGRQNQNKVDQWLDGKITEKEFIKVFATNWGVYDHVYYRDILHFIREHHIPLLALNAGKKEKMAVFKKNTDDQNYGSDIYQDTYQQQALSSMFAGHKNGQGGYENFIAVQELWEETMTGSIVNYLASDIGKDKKIIVITGGFHVAYGFGIPRRVFKRLKAPFEIVLSHTPEELVENERQQMDVNFPELPLYRAGYLWCVPYRNLKDKQVKLGAILTEKENEIRVVKVIEDGAAHQAGLLPGDRIVSLDAQSINSTFDLQYLLIRKKIGDHAVIDIIRNNHPVQLPLDFKEGL